jgi:hypothetical protein
MENGAGRIDLSNLNHQGGTPLVQYTVPALAMGMALGVPTSAFAAKFQTANFEVTAESPEVAKAVAEEAEKWRATLARHWLKSPIEDWPEVCQIEVRIRRTGGSGWTSYEKLGGKLVGVGIELQGPPERLLEYVLPHELTHAVLVLALGEAMPRWADEGAAMLSESDSQKLRQKLLVKQLVQSGNAIPARQLLEMADYPASKSRLHAFYAQSQTLTEFLIARGGPRQFLKFVRDGRDESWDLALSRHYKWENIEAMEGAWSEWLQKNAERQPLPSAEQIITSN